MAAYTINVPEDRLGELHSKLAVATFPDELDQAVWDYGSPLSEVKRLTSYWRNGFSWKEQEASLNTLPQFHRSIAVPSFAPLDIHYIHQPSEASNAIPLLFCHGWPGSYLEVRKLLPLLNGLQEDVSFHLVAPSLPNFAWSEGPKRKGFGLREYAETCHRLMLALGYPRYVTQGGDWGFYITRAMGLLHPEAVLASHINMIRANPPSYTSNPILAAQHTITPYSQRENEGLVRSKWFADEGSGYRLLQSTKPQTIGYALTDSPVALLAWMLEKLHDWTDSYPWTDDEILTWVSIYWCSRMGPAASLRIYYEATHLAGVEGAVTRDRTSEWIGGVKLGLCFCPRELTILPVTWARTLGPVVFESFKERGGHFAAHEVPKEVAKDLREMFGKGGPCHRIMEAGSKL